MLNCLSAINKIHSDRPYAHKSYISKNFKRAVFEYKRVFHCEGHDYEEFPHEIAFVWTFFHKENENAQ